ncbi:MAG: hypothetical protein ACOYVJ_08810 [Nitrospirota bacterium]
MKKSAKNIANSFSLYFGEVYQRIALSACMLLLYASVPLYAWYTQASTIVSRDQWHHLTMLTRYFNGDFKPSLLLLSHGEHAQLAYNLWFFLNGIFLGLNTRLELFLGLIFLGVFLLVLYKEFSLSLNDVNSKIQRQILFFPILLIALSFNQQVSFNYSLLSFVGFGNALLRMIFLSLLNQYLIQEQTSVFVLPVMAFVFLVLGIGFAGGGWVINLGAAFLIFFAWVIVHRPDKRRIFSLGAVLFCLAGLSYYVYSLCSPRGSVASSADGVSHIVQNMDQAGIYVLLLLANSILDINALGKSNLMGIAYTAGVMLLIAYLLAVFAFFKTKMWEKTYIPLFMIFYLWLIILALLVHRFPGFGVANAASPRYATALQIGLLGVIWIFIFSMRNMESGVFNFNKIGWRILLLTTFLLYGLHFKSAVKAAPVFRNFHEKAKQIVLQEKFENRSVVCPNVNLCRQGIVTLKEHQLNVYRVRPGQKAIQ